MDFRAVRLDFTIRERHGCSWAPGVAEDRISFGRDSSSMFLGYWKGLRSRYVIPNAAVGTGADADWNPYGIHGLFYVNGLHHFVVRRRVRQKPRTPELSERYSRELIFHPRAASSRQLDAHLRM